MTVHTPSHPSPVPVPMPAVAGPSCTKDSGNPPPAPGVTRRLCGTAGIELPLLGFGLMRLPQKDGGIDRETAAGMVDRAMASGCNYFDTAYMYHDGESEKFVGEVLAKYPRESYYLTSKMPIHDLTCEADNERIFSEQLRRTRAGYFDFYFMHWLNEPHWDIARRCRTWEFMTRMRDEGKIRHLGFSYHGEPEVLETIARAHPWELAQIQLNYLDWELCRSGEQYEILTRLGIPVAVMEPLKGGTLVQLNDGAREIFHRAAPETGAASWGLRYAASLPNVNIVLSGMSSPEQLADNLKTFSPFRALDDDERKIISDALAAYRRSSTVPCTACRYCSPCPSGVDIPRNLALYNQIKAQGSAFYATLVYKAMPESRRADSCVACGVCSSRCPQRIDIPKFMRETAQEFK